MVGARALLKLELEEIDIETPMEEYSLTDDQARLALSRALNRAAITLRKGLILFVRQKYQVKARDLREVLKVRKSTPDDLEIRLYTPKGKPGIPLFNFLAGRKKVPSTHWVRGKARPKLGVKVKIFREKAPVNVLGGFTSRMKSGHRGLFKRMENRRMIKDPKKQAIRELYSLSPEAMIVISGAQKEANLDDQAADLLDKYLEKEIRYIIGK